MAKSFKKPTRLTTRIEKATLVGIELLHPNLDGELAPILCRQLLDSVQHSMPNDKVTESDLLIALNKLYRKGHLAEFQIQASPEDGSLMFMVRGSDYAERSRGYKQSWRRRYTAYGLKYTIAFLTPEQAELVQRLHSANLARCKAAIAQDANAKLVAAVQPVEDEATQALKKVLSAIGG